MFAAVFEMTSWAGKEQFLFKGNSPDELLEKFEDIQSLECLVRMGRGQEDAEGKKALDIIEGILLLHAQEKLTVDELMKLDVKLSLGEIKCLCIVDDPLDIENLQKEYPGTRM